MDDTNITDDFESHSGSELSLSSQSVSFLSETRKWAKFFAILGFIGVGFTVLAALFAGAFMETMGQQLPFPSVFLTVIYLIVSVIMFFPVYYLFKFSNNMKTALNHNDGTDLTTAFQNLKSCFKFYGIFTIIMLGIYGLAFIGGMIGAIVGGLG